MERPPPAEHHRRAAGRVRQGHLPFASVVRPGAPPPPDPTPDPAGGSGRRVRTGEAAVDVQERKRDANGRLKVKGETYAKTDCQRWKNQSKFHTQLCSG